MVENVDKEVSNFVILLPHLRNFLDKALECVRNSFDISLEKFIRTTGVV